MEQESHSPMIRIRGVKKRLAGKWVLNGVDLSIPAGETHVVIGRSGEGKSVLLKHLCGLFQPDEGEVWIDGQEISRLTEKELYPVRAKIGLLFQGAALFDSLTVKENVGFSLYEHDHLSELEIENRVLDNLKMVRLGNVLDKMPSELSGGMRKRVGLARAITRRPKIILYDEPTTGLDPVTADAINDLIVHLSQELKVTSVVVTHDLASAFKVGNKFSMLFEGKIIYTGTPDEVRKTENPYIRQFIDGKAEGPLTGLPVGQEEDNLSVQPVESRKSVKQ
ncbi:MAG TPA: ABC transporter ATP-binding protein [bacterium]|nr:ABC transporter ATP-binding protein [bacterium]HQP97936.1 ABC transporter ATP-binding protein [bacterium]